MRSFGKELVGLVYNEFELLEFIIKFLLEVVGIQQMRAISSKIISYQSTIYIIIA